MVLERGVVNTFMLTFPVSLYGYCSIGHSASAKMYIILSYESSITHTISEWW